MESSAKRDLLRPKTGAGVQPRGLSDPALDRAIQAQIGDKLRKMYGELTDQPVPDRFTALLAQLGKPRSGADS